MSSIEFEPGSVVVVTGASGGIGESTARRFAEGGADVALIDAHNGVFDVSRALSEKFPGRRFEAFVSDVTDEHSLAEAREGIVTAFGRVDHLAIIAGVVQKAAPIDELGLDEWNRVFSVNSLGVFLTAKTFIPLLKKQPKGTIVAIASYWARTSPPLFAAYSASKAAVFSICQTLAGELAPFGIRVNAVAPGQINTSMHRNALESEAASRGITFEEMKSLEWGKIPLARAGEPESIADAVAFLSSPAASYATGASLDINGGVVYHWVIDFDQSDASMIGQTIKNTEPSPNVAVVTGAAGGIGRAIATRFAQDGTTVVLADIRAEAASSTAEAVAAETAATVVGLTVDVTDSASVKELVNQVVERLDVSIT